MSDFDPLLQQRHLRLLHTLKAAGIQATCGEDDQWMVTMPSARHYGWLSFDELEPPLGEWVVVIPRNPEWRMRVVQRVPPERDGYDMANDRGAVSRMTDYLFWMPRP